MLYAIRLIPFKKYYNSFTIMSKNPQEKNPNVFDLINIVTRQTDYTNDTALDQLQENNYDPIAVIRKFMEPQSTPVIKKPEEKTLNQRVYHEMRSMLDTANAAYRAKKEREEEMEKQKMNNH